MIKSIILFLFVLFSGTELISQTVNDYVNISQDSSKLEDLEEVIIIAPNPPVVELGTYSRIVNYPLGIHLSTARGGNRHRIIFDFATNTNENYFYNFRYSLNKRFRKQWLDDILNPYINGVILSSNRADLERFDLANRFYFHELINLHIGTWTDLNFNKFSPIFGIGSYLQLDRYTDNLILNKSYFELRTYLGEKNIDWTISYDFEIYNKNYRCLGALIGYEAISGINDFVLKISYNHYFVNRKALGMK